MANYSLCGYTNGSGYTEVNDRLSQETIDAVQGIVRRRINFASFLASAGIAVNATSDKIAVMTVNQGNLVTLAYLAVLKNDSMADGGTGATCPVALGDDSAPTGFIASYDLAAAGNAAPAASAYNTPKAYMAAGGSAITLQVLGQGTATNPKRPLDAIVEVGACILDILPFLRSKNYAVYAANKATVPSVANLLNTL